jgi:hypothetical protein
MILAAKLFEDGKLSKEQTAQIAGLSKGAFIEVLVDIKFLFSAVLFRIYVLM